MKRVILAILAVVAVTAWVEHRQEEKDLDF